MAQVDAKVVALKNDAKEMITTMLGIESPPYTRAWRVAAGPFPCMAGDQCTTAHHGAVDLDLFEDGRLWLDVTVGTREAPTDNVAIALSAKELEELINDLQAAHVAMIGVTA